jgi:retron-type reverse transcriptase
MMMLSKLAEKARNTVGYRPDPRWRRSSDYFVRSDGFSKKTWFERHWPEARIQMVEDAQREGRRWSSLVRIYLPKYGTADMRPIDIPTILDQARLYPLQDWLSECVEPRLYKRAVAYRRGRRMSSVVWAVERAVSERGYHWGAVVDVQDYFGSLCWATLDELISSLPGDRDVQDALRRLVRVPVIDQASRALVGRHGRGIPQGLSVSPALANLYLAEWDNHVAHVISKSGAIFFRYSDDILVLARDRAGAEEAVKIVLERLPQRGLKAKPGAKEVIDMTSARLRWLKIDFSVDGINVGDDIVQWKIGSYHHKVDRGLFTTTRLEQSIAGLEAYYSKILPAPRVNEVSGWIREGTRDLFARLSAPSGSDDSNVHRERRSFAT